MKKQSKILCAILTVCMMLTILPLGVLAASNEPVNFSDIDTSKLKDYILYWANEPAIDGGDAQYVIGGYPDGTFKPNDNITRGAAAAILDRAFGFDSTGKVTEFSDVAKDNVFYTNIMTCAENKVVNGYEDGSFKPSANISRQAAIAMIARCAMTEDDYKEFSDDAACKEILAKFSDASAISDKFYAEFCFLVEYGNLEGYEDGSVKPGDSITRAQFVKLLYSIAYGNGMPVVPGKNYTLEVSVAAGDKTVKASADQLGSKSVLVTEILKLAEAKREELEEAFPSEEMSALINDCADTYAEYSKDGWTDEEVLAWINYIGENFGEAEGDMILILAGLDPEACLSELSCDTYTLVMKDSEGTEYTLTVTVSETAAE